MLVAGQDEVSYSQPFRYGDSLEVEGNLRVHGQYQDADGNPISTGGSTSTYVLPAATGSALGGGYKASGLSDSRGVAFMSAFAD